MSLCSFRKSTISQYRYHVTWNSVADLQLDPVLCSHVPVKHTHLNHISIANMSNLLNGVWRWWALWEHIFWVTFSEISVDICIKHTMNAMYLWCGWLDLALRSMTVQHLVQVYTPLPCGTFFWITVVSKYLCIHNPETLWDLVMWLCET